MRRKPKELTPAINIGDRFGRLEVVGPADRSGRKIKYPARCDCGQSKLVLRNSLLAGTQSCGCLAREVASRVLREMATKHGEVANGKPSPLYVAWANMRRRCEDPTNKRFADYGGRGIRVCPEWADFAVFKRWALANGYQPHLQLDREDNNGSYEPSNCRWSTRVTQQRNMRSNRLVTAFGETKCLAAWIDDQRCVVGARAFQARIVRGWEAEQALTAPAQKRTRR